MGINAVERLLGDEAIRRGWTVQAPSVSSGKQVLVVGSSGRAGLSAAYHLRLLGHAVTIREAQERPFGMVRYGIPRYRLPREVLDAEIDRILSMGITLECGPRVDDVQHADGGRLTIERMRLDETGFPQPTGEFEELDADTVVLALGQDSDLTLLKVAGNASSETTATASARTARSSSWGRARGFAIDLDYCKGCGLCVAEYPSGAMDMVPEE